MNRQQIREIAEIAFKTQFSDVDVVRVDVKERLDHDEDPVVDVGIIYDGKYEQLNGSGLLRVQSDIISKAWQEVEDDIGFPLVHFFPESSVRRRDRETRPLRELPDV